MEAAERERPFPAASGGWDEGDPRALTPEPGRRRVTRRAFVDRVLGAALAPALLGCGVARGARQEARLGARPGPPTREPTHGRSALGLGSGRDGLLYVPRSYAGEAALPLLVALHGAGGSAGNWASYPERAEALGFVLLAPDSRGRTWDAVQGGFGPDVRFLDQALAHTFERCRIDPGRIALGGFSDGASYALSLGVANGDLFTHLIAYSPGFYVTDAARPGKPRVFVSHGRSDRILSFARTERSIVPGLSHEGYDVAFHPFDGGHDVPGEISDAAFAWFLGGQPPTS